MRLISASFGRPISKPLKRNLGRLDELVNMPIDEVAASVSDMDRANAWKPDCR